MTTARCCGATFSGKAEHCTNCCLTFTGSTSGDQHRTGPYSNRRCRTPDELLAKGLESRLNAQGTPIWGRRMGQEHLKSLSPHAVDGLTGYEWPPVPTGIFQGLYEEESA